MNKVSIILAISVTTSCATEVHDGILEAPKDSRQDTEGRDIELRSL